MTMPSTPAPDFATLLAPFISSVPAAAVPAFLARLERTAAARYRMWAEALPAHAEGLMECAAREDAIAERVLALYPANEPAQLSAMDAAIAPAKETYYAVFSALAPIEQMAIQANAERQGAAAWRAMIDDEPEADKKTALEACARIEEESADFLDALLATLAPGS